jgi:hypothetical protein
MQPRLTVSRRMHMPSALQLDDQSFISGCLADRTFRSAKQSIEKCLANGYEPEGVSIPYRSNAVRRNLMVALAGKIAIIMHRMLADGVSFRNVATV